MSTISYEVNNGGKLTLNQRNHDGDVLIIKTDSKGNHESINDNEAFISASDMLMLINYYRYIKSNNIQCDFINPNGTKQK
jgi:hypothetical protein